MSILNVIRDRPERAQGCVCERGQNLPPGVVGRDILS